jgi:hypothetical protein
MRNPVQEYNIARSMPIQALAAVLQGKSDMVSLGVAHAALKEKMEAEVAKKGASAMQMAQAPKIKDKDLAMAQGLGASPADIDVPMGGIVGGEGTFGTGAAGGGSVVAFQPGGSVYKQPTATPTFGGMMQRQAASAPGFMDKLRQGLGAVGRFATSRGSLMGPSLMLATPDLNVGEEEYLAVIKKLANMGYPAEMIEAMSPEQRVAAAQGKLPTGQADTGGVPTQTLAQMEAPQAAPPQGAAAPGGGPAAPTGGIADLAAAQARVPGVAQTQVAPSTVEPPLSFDDADKLAEQLMGKYKIEPGKRKEFTDFSKEYVDTLKNAGYDFDLVKNQVRELANEKEALKGEKKEAQNLRLLEAGLGILGGESRHAFVNIGKGATPALQGLAKDLKEIKKTSRQLDKETMQLNLLQNQMAEGKVKYSQDRLDKQEDRFQRIVEKDMDNRLSLAKTLSSNAVTKYATDKSADTSLKVAQIGATKEGDTLRAIREMPGATLEEKAAAWTKATNKRLDPAEAAYIKTLETFATEDPGGRKLERLKESNPALYARIKQDLATYGLRTGMITEKPDSGSIRN